MALPNNFDLRRRYDAIVVGTGLTGSWVAKELAEAGLQILVIEAGPYIPLHEALDIAGWGPARRSKAAAHQQIQARHPAYGRQNPMLFVDDIKHPYTVPEDGEFVWVRGRQVGGRSLMWGGMALRFSDYEFRGTDYGGAEQTWPITYRDLAPWYDKVERYLQVCGTPENLPQLPDGYFASPTTMTPKEESFKMAVESRWPLRKVIPCRVIPGPARNALTTTLLAALITGNVDLLPNSVVSHLVIDAATGYAKGVAFLHGETKESYVALGRVVTLCASTIESVRIMLNSRCPVHPNGVGNSSGCLGKYLMDHKALSIEGFTDGPVFSSVAVGSTLGFSVPRYVNIEGQNYDFRGGYGIWGSIQQGAAGIAARRIPWFLAAQLEVLASEHNSITIDPEVKDAWGVPAVRIRLKYGENEERMGADAMSSLLELAAAGGLVAERKMYTVPGQFVHEVGGARMGTSCETSVLNRINQCWDAPNLFVLDGSCFVTSGWQNPSLTMMALAVRGAATIAEGLKAGLLN